MSVQDEHGYWDSMSEQERNLSDLSKPKKQDKNMSVEDELIGRTGLLEKYKKNTPPVFWRKSDGAKFLLREDEDGDDIRYDKSLYSPIESATLDILLMSSDFSPFPLNREEPLDFCQTYQPEIWNVKKDTIYAAITAVEDGLEFAREVLARHDIELGRDTKKNKSWAETIEASIRQMELTLKLLKDCPEK